MLHHCEPKCPAKYRWATVTVKVTVRFQVSCPRSPKLSNLLPPNLGKRNIVVSYIGLVCYLHIQDHSEGSKSQEIDFSPISFELMDLSQPNLVRNWCTIVNQRFSQIISNAVSKVKMSVGFQILFVCSSFLTRPLCYPTWFHVGVLWDGRSYEMIWLLSSKSRSHNHDILKWRCVPCLLKIVPVHPDLARACIISTQTDLWSGSILPRGPTRELALVTLNAGEKWRGFVKIKLNERGT